MDFALNEEQEMFREYLRKYLNDVGQTKVARNFIKGDLQGFLDIHSGLTDLGCTSINISEEYGGLGLSSLDLVPFFEEIGRSLLPGVYLETMAFAVPLLELYGTTEQKENYLPQIASGSKKITLAWLEPNKSFNPDEVECSAEINGDSLIINGVKTLVSDGDIADIYILLVRTGEEVEEGLSLVLVDHSEEIKRNNLKCVDESKHLAELKFNSLAVPINQVVGPINQGWSLLQEGLLYLNAALSSQMVGGMDRVVEMSTEYAKIREQFGQPIGRFQAIKHRIVDMKLELETARSLSYYANWTLENSSDDRAAAIYSARSFAAEAYIRSASQNIQIHGGIGFTEEIDCHLYLKRARYFENYLGSSQDYNEQVALALAW
ncbi:acyl-CoA dehydrogenase family protein [Virgibacillus salexigens]|uniref:Acyl-CoA dehydrogenase n=1 Tax=Virgibacillus massiliensis TaxID=1462526 RepID=A0A024QE27_9BACI|nr:acyl-CoA dehydrogenase family protein [Virgibacillus massiliensis]CDQ40462.1 Acyl-CoA dehydrogenase [Virgibacillus massiliensis]